MRFFNVAGPCDSEINYMVPTDPRLPSARKWIDRRQYFVVHAPRQTGKTTALRLLARELTAEGEYAALHFSCQAAGTADGIDETARVILDQITRAAAIALPPQMQPPSWPEAPEGARLINGLTAWAKACPRPLVLLFDEIDAVRGRNLLSVLHQLRAGYEVRPDNFPSSVVLSGLRDVRDYKIKDDETGGRTSSTSPFNISVESVRLGDFDEDDIANLYAQHTADTGQKFTTEALAEVWESTQGQPWLVNALAGEIVDEIEVPSDQQITTEHVLVARERIIKKQATHLDNLVDKLYEPRVERIIAPLVAGQQPSPSRTFEDDVSYVRDLGLVAQGRPLRYANSIYREIIVRVLGSVVAEAMTEQARDYVNADGALDWGSLLDGFRRFWLRSGELMTRRDAYHEAAAQVVFLAYLARLINGGGFVTHEEALGRDRIDVFVRWPYRSKDGRRRTQEHAVELKVWRDKQADPQDSGMEQLDRYLDRLDQETGTLVVFDRRTKAPPIAERTAITTTTSPAGRSVTLMRA